MDANGGLIHEKNKPSPSANFNTPWIGAVYLTGPFSAARGGAEALNTLFATAKKLSAAPGPVNPHSITWTMTTWVCLRMEYASIYLHFGLENQD